MAKRSKDSIYNLGVIHELGLRVVWKVFARRRPETAENAFTAKTVGNLAKNRA